MKVATEKEFEEEEEIEEEEEAPPDGGWGWFCVVGCALMHTILIGTERTFGLIYLELIDKFEESAALTAWVGSLTTALRMGLGPLATFLCNKYSCRTVTMVGGGIFFLGVLLSAFPPNLYYLFVTWGMLVGIGGAMVYTPSFIIVGKYFDKRRAIANGISTAGGGVGQFCFPPLFTALMNFYGYTGSLMVIAAVGFNLINCGVLYRPLRLLKIVPERPGSCEIGVIYEADEAAGSSDEHEYIEFKDMAKESQEKGQEGHDGEDTISEAHDGEDIIDESAEYQKVPQTCDTDSVGHPESPPSDRQQDQIENVDLITVAPLVVSPNDVTPPVAGPSDIPPVPNPDDVPSVSQDGRSEIGTKRKKKTKQPRLDYTLLCDITFILFAVFIGLGTQAYVPTTTFLPALAQSRGLTKEDATILLSVIGAADMCGRLGSGFLFDIKRVQRIRKYVYGLAPFLLCVFLMAFSFATENWQFIVVCVGYGLSVGMFLSQIASLLVDWLGKENLPSALGLATFFRGAGVMIGPVIGGLLRDQTGQYTTSFYYSASAAFSGGMVYMGLIALYIYTKRNWMEQIQPEISCS